MIQNADIYKRLLFSGLWYNSEAWQGKGKRQALFHEAQKGFLLNFPIAKEVLDVSGGGPVLFIEDRSRRDSFFS
jgi:hypothetical protein